MDNAATSFPKPPCVHEAVLHYATRLGASAGRGAYAEAQDTGRIIQQCRERLCRLINAPNPDHLIMTFNCSDGLNLAIYGLLGEGDHAIATEMDHNSVLRPLNELRERIGLEVDFVRCDAAGLVDPDDVRQAIKPNTKLLAVLHASNVTGSVQPIHDLARVAHDHGALILIDAAQTVGHWPIDVQSDRIDLLAAAGHKGPLGPLGTGFLYIRNGVEQQLCTLKQGGTGTRSEQATQPDDLPDKYEVGSHNAIGIAGLNAAAGWILDRTVLSLRQHDRQLGERFAQDLDAIDGLHWYGPRDLEKRIGVFSVRLDGYGPDELSSALEAQFGILTRSGLHCAPWAHKTIGTLEFGGTTRLSFGPFLTIQDIDHALDALSKLARHKKPHRELVAEKP
jgi:cysteine desulfurase family protein